ncbi:hypothetical protein BVC80_1801g11 [Macleaya cordata]|uniref:Transmembrane protein n=1 Tax=Macleaya cordata TaxID=56857 RepID=A0A200PML5_MACCD|nr:hypothetical protein BVC80_1801g11 [Macleaya cordata]
MDREPEELQFMGLFGIYKEAYKITVAWRKIFSQITLSLILPLSFIYLAQIQISELILAKIDDSQEVEAHATRGTSNFNRIHAHIVSEWISFGIFKAIYLLFLLIFSLLSTSAVVYTIACIYTSKDITFKKVISVVPKVWKRLMVTFLWNFFIMILYIFLAFLLMTSVFILTLGRDGEGSWVNAFWVLLIIIFIPYFIGFVYINVVWQLASVVSVMEEIYGIKAMIKSVNLIKGKILISSFIFTKLQISFTAILIVFKILVVHGESLGMVRRVSLGIFFFLLLTIFIHFALVIQTVIYFVCKSYHHQNIDKSDLAEHLEVYNLGDYVPLMRDKDVQLEQFHV